MRGLRGAVLAVSWFAVLGSALSVVTARHQARDVFRTLQALELARDQLDIEWSQLSIEQGMLADPANIESLAREQLSMRSPRSQAIVLVEHEPEAERKRKRVLAQRPEPAARRN